MRLSKPLRLTSHSLSQGHWYPRFSTVSTSGEARIGELHLSRLRLRTPALFPVFNMLTGPATHGLKRTGGIFKYLKRWVLLDERYPCYLSEVLHFSDFRLSPAMLDRWLPRDGTRNLHTWMEEWFLEEGRVPSRSALFSDSGGFRLLFNTEMDLEHFGVRPTPQNILALQLRFGADMAASLDYPLPPNTPPGEEAERSKRSQENALRMMDLLDDVPDGSAPLPYLAVHGQTPSGIRAYVRELLRRLHERGVSRPFGLAIGSLVPRRSNYEVVVALVHAAMDELRISPLFDSSTIPVHVFGVTGDMIPVLAYLGADTFDSSSHIQSARALGYYEPDTWKPVHFGKLDDVECACTACQEIRRQGMPFMQEMLDAKGYRTYVNPRTDEEFLKSEVYALVAWHNLRLQIEEIDTTRRAIADGDLLEHVVRVGTLRPRAQKLLSYLAEVDVRVEQRLAHVPPTLFPVVQDADTEQEPGGFSLSHTPDDFNILKRDYHPAAAKQALLIVPCSSEKPYSASRSHRLLTARITEHLGPGALEAIEKVSLSGLYGPVPQEFEDSAEIISYNYYLNTSAHAQLELITNRLTEFLQLHGKQFELVVGYATARAYRTAMERAFHLTGRGLVLPRSPSGTGAGEFSKRTHLDELASELSGALSLPASVM